MKLLILLIALSCFYCTHSQKNNEQSKEETITTNIDTVEVTDSLIIGFWSICSQEYDGIIMMCNICSYIEFAENGTGKFIHVEGQDLIFNYRLFSDNTIKISFDTKQEYFDETEYTYQYIKEEEDSEELKLISKKVNQIYNLKK